MSLKKLLVQIVILALIIGTFSCKSKSVEELLAHGKFNAAEKRCEKLKGNEQQEGFKSIAYFYLQEEKYKKAADYYAKAQEHVKVINSYFQGDYIYEAEQYCQALTGDIKKQCAQKLGRKFFLQGDYKKSIDYYKQAENTNEISNLQAKVPLFELIERLDQKSLEIKDINVNKKIASFKKTISTYIYMDRFLKWPYDKKEEPYKTAAGLHGRAIQLLESQLVPNFQQLMNSETIKWTTEGVETAVFANYRLDSIIALINNLHHIADKYEFFIRFARIFRENLKEKDKQLDPITEYEAVYKKALEHAETLLQEISDSENITDTQLIMDYHNDIDIDNQIVEYIASMLNNINLRVDDIRKRNVKFKNSSQDQANNDIANRIFREYIIECSRVLNLVSKEEYQKANDLLLSGYETAKTELIDITK